VRDQLGYRSQGRKIIKQEERYIIREEYYMGEIFRAGLNFKLKVGARPRVLPLSRKVQK